VISPDVPTPCPWAIKVATSKHTRRCGSDFIGFFRLQKGAQWHEDDRPSKLLFSKTIFPPASDSPESQQKTWLRSNMQPHFSSPPNVSRIGIILIEIICFRDRLMRANNSPRSDGFRAPHLHDWTRGYPRWRNSSNELF
jgi:hypothetical protein